MVCWQLLSNRAQYNICLANLYKQKFLQKKWDMLGYTDDDLRMLEIDLLEKGDKYPVIKGTGGLRKCRLKLQNKGKSGGSRVLFVNFVKL